MQQALEETGAASDQGMAQESLLFGGPTMNSSTSPRNQPSHWFYKLLYDVPLPRIPMIFLQYS